MKILLTSSKLGLITWKMKRHKIVPHNKGMVTSDRLELLGYRLIGFLVSLYEVVRAIIHK